MSLTRQQRILDSQSALATKVFSAVPIADSWTSNQITSELMRKQMSFDHAAVMGCLSALVRAGLISENKGQFKREPVRKVATPVIEEGTPVTKIQAIKPEESKVVVTSLDKLANLASTLQRYANDLITLSNTLADTAIEIEEEIERKGGDTKKLKQLQVTLKALMGDE